MNCDEAYLDSFYLPKFVTIMMCKKISKGENIIGLTDITTQFLTNINIALERFEASDRSLSTIGSIFAEISNSFSYICGVGSLIYFKLYDAALHSFDELSKNLASKSTLFAFVSLPIGIIIGLVTWIWAMQDILEMENEKNKLLSVIPTRMILSNLRLKKWLKDNTGSHELRHLL